MSKERKPRIHKFHGTFCINPDLSQSCAHASVIFNLKNIENVSTLNPYKMVLLLSQFSEDHRKMNRKKKING